MEADGRSDISKNDDPIFRRTKYCESRQHRSGAEKKKYLIVKSQPGEFPLSGSAAQIGKMDQNLDEKVGVPVILNLRRTSLTSHFHRR